MFMVAKLMSPFWTTAFNLFCSVTESKDQDFRTIFPTLKLVKIDVSISDLNFRFVLLFFRINGLQLSNPFSSICGLYLILLPTDIDKQLRS